MSQGWIQLQLDIARENLREKNAFNTALANQRKREKKWYEGGIIGSVLGAIGGFLVGSVPGAIAGYNIGKEVGTQYHAHDDEDELSEELAAEVFGGGKFSKHQMREAVKDLKATVSDQYDALYVCIMNYDHDLRNVAPTGFSAHRNGMRYTDYTGTSRDPYVDYTLAAVTAADNAIFFGTNF